MMRTRYLGVVLATAVAAPLLMSHQTVSAASAHTCAGRHIWSLPVNGTAFVLSATLSDGWDRTCANVDSSSTTFGIVQANHDVVLPAQPTSTFAGDCAFGFATHTDLGIRYFVGGVVVGAGVQGSMAAQSVGVLGTPSATPCTGGGITWDGYEMFTYTP
jgi:hypothetical protein